jgi:hypothetical protein
MILRADARHIKLADSLRQTDKKSLIHQNSMMILS